jgi:hypothetical protein
MNRVDLPIVKTYPKIKHFFIYFFVLNNLKIMNEPMEYIFKI